jgi:sodium/bile acid cotransporter 7
MLWGFLRRHWFLFALLASLALGFLFPQADAVLNPRNLTRTGLIVALFIIMGLTLPSESIRAGLADWRLHLYLQGFLFLLTPAYFLLTTLPFRASLNPDLLAGVLALSCLPTTIASCIIFTQLAGGNVTGTMFNAAASNILGVFLSPLLLSLLLRGAGRLIPASQLAGVLRDLAVQILVPIAAGQLLRRLLQPAVERRRAALAVLANILLLGVILLTFVRSAGTPGFLAQLRGALGLFLYLAVSHLILVALAYFGARALRFAPANVISAVFAAPQKTLALGVPLLATFFARSPEALGLVMLPVLFYHPWQLLVAGLLRSAIGAGLFTTARRS